MRIKEEIKKSGYFWLPSSPQKRVPGTLTISDGGMMELEIAGMIENDIASFLNTSWWDRIIGIIEPDQDITLDGCTPTKKTSTSGGISKSLLHIQRAFFGVAYNEGQDPYFNSFRFSVEGIDEWAEISGIKVDTQLENRATTISYKQPEDILVQLDNGMQLIITFNWTFPGFPRNKEAKVTQKTYFKLVSQNERKLDEFISIAENIATFLCFAINQVACIDSMTAFSDNLIRKSQNRETSPIPVDIYTKKWPFSKDVPKINPALMLFRFGKIRNDAEIKINKWIKAYEQTIPAFHLYFWTRMKVHPYLEASFLTLAQGLEVLHRRTSDDRVMDESEFEELKNHLIDQCPSERRKWLEGKLNHGNEVNLRKRIKSLIEPFKHVFGNSDERNRLIHKIVKIRNELTHEASIANSNEELLSLCDKMELLFELHFLHLISFSQEEIDSIVTDCSDLQRKLKS
ncbi:MAG: hypothetical protein OXU23_10390 [Candidatus Poribacteria bacterium]|nr:hypothetical protein [Candidatus Poribacteria bacterium]